jgi:hypothetical protein
LVLKIYRLLQSFLYIDDLDWERRDPETGSRIPSISTGGAAMNAIIKTELAVNKVGIIKTPNHPM